MWGPFRAIPRNQTSRILDLIRQPEGATLAAIMEATGWQRYGPHPLPRVRQ